MTICVIATASALRGAFTIYLQFVDALSLYGGDGCGSISTVSRSIVGKME